MKPKIFLSHSKKDKEFIEKVANILRPARIDCWYDDWEISPGDSLTRKILDEGIGSCDLFLIYLTENSIDSKWVNKELDVALLNDIESNNGHLLVFVNSKDTLEKLKPSLKILNCTILNDKEFTEPLLKLTSKTWEHFGKKQVSLERERKERTNIDLEKKIISLEKELDKYKVNNSIEIPRIISTLEQRSFEIENETLNGIQLFSILKDTLATGTTAGGLEYFFERYLLFNSGKTILLDDDKGKLILQKITGILIVLGLLEKNSKTTKNGHLESFMLSDLGIALYQKLEKISE